MNYSKKILSVKHLTGRKYFHRVHNGQKGSLLIGLIIAMVILSSLGASMVYFFGSSVLDPVFSNFSQRAFYAAESGMRYAISTYWKNSGMTKDLFVSTLNNKALSFPNNGGATLTVSDKMPGETVDVSATVLTTATDYKIGKGGSLPVNANALKFPDKNGFFQIKDQTGYLTYKKKVAKVGGGYDLMEIFGPGVETIPVNTGTEITAPFVQVSVKSKGYYPLPSFFGMSRMVEYVWILSNKAGGGGADDYGAGNQDLLDLPGMKLPTPLSGDNRFEVVPFDKLTSSEAVLQGNVDVKDPSPGISINLISLKGVKYEYVYININWWNLVNSDGVKLLDVNQAYLKQGSTLSYDLQIKQMESYLGSSDQINNFLVGLSARVESNSMLLNKFYGISLFYSALGQEPENIPEWLKSTTLNSNNTLSTLDKGKYYLVFWKMENNVRTVIGTPTIVPNSTVSPYGETDRRADWPTLVFRIKETGTGISKTNTISVIIYDKIQNPRGTLNWPLETKDLANPSKPYWANSANPIYNLPDTFLTTGILTAIPNTRPEIGVHVFSDSGADNKLFLDDLAIKMIGAGPTGIDYQPPIIVGP